MAVFRHQLHRARVAVLAVLATTITCSSPAPTGLTPHSYSGAHEALRAPVVMLEISVPRTTLDVGDSVQAIATLRAADGRVLNGRKIAWSSSVPAVASVTTRGLVHARRAGTTNLQASSEGVSGTIQISVVDASTPPPPDTTSPPPDTTTPPDTTPPPTGTREVLFASDWSTAVGVSDAALRDAGKPLPWDVIMFGSRNVLEVVPATGRNFPAGMTNVLRVLRPAGDAPYTFARIAGKWPTPAVGEALYYRIYLRNEIANSETSVSESSHHPVQTDPSGPWSWKFATTADGSFPLRLSLPHNAWPFNSWYLGPNRDRLAKFRTYRFEWMIRRTADTLAEVSARVFDESNVLLYSEDGVGAARGAMTTSNGTQLVTLKSMAGRLVVRDPSQLRNLEVGTNGGPTYTQSQYFFWGGVAVCRNAWCGPY